MPTRATRKIVLDVLVVLVALAAPMAYAQKNTPLTVLVGGVFFVIAPLLRGYLVWRVPKRVAEEQSVMVTFA